MTLPQMDIELVLMRQLATSLALPVFIVDTATTMVFYNEPAEKILDCRFDETGAMPAEQWGVMFRPTDDQGQPLAPAELPLIIAVAEGRPAHRSIWIRSLGGVPRRIEVTAFPLIGQHRRLVGGVAICWEDAAT